MRVAVVVVEPAPPRREVVLEEDTPSTLTSARAVLVAHHRHPLPRSTRTPRLPRLRPHGRRCSTVVLVVEVEVVVEGQVEVKQRA